MDQSLFWKKKTTLSYVLAVLVFIIHISALCNYSSAAGDDSFMNPWRWFVLTVCRCAVPAFFILSGAVFFRDYDNSKYVKKLKNRVSSLIVPYLTWNTIWMFFGVITTMFFSQYFLKRAPSDITPLGIFLSIVHWSDNAPFWFIFNLIVFIVISPIIYYALKNKYIGVLVITIVIALTHCGYGLYQKVFYMPDSIIYYLAGAYVGLHFFDWFSARSKTKTIVGLLCFIGCIVIRSLTPVETYNMFIWDKSGFSGPLLLIVFGFSICFVFDIFSYSKPLPNFLSHSFWVYAMHLNLSAVLCKLLYFALPKTIVFAWVNFFITIILTLTLIELTAILFKRYCPFGYKILSGAR